jgi:hypothetical protein
MLARHVRHELGAGGIGRVVEISPRVLALLEDAPILVVLKGRAVVVEKPPELGRIGEAIVEDGVVRTVEQACVRTSLSLAVAARPVLELVGSGIDGADQTREYRRAGQPIETVAVCRDHEAHVGPLTTEPERARKAPWRITQSFAEPLAGARCTLSRAARRN